MPPKGSKKTKADAKPAEVKPVDAKLVEEAKPAIARKLLHLTAPEEERLTKHTRQGLQEVVEKAKAAEERIKKEHALGLASNDVIHKQCYELEVGEAHRALLKSPEHVPNPDDRFPLWNKEDPTANVGFTEEQAGKPKTNKDLFDAKNIIFHRRWATGEINYACQWKKASTTITNAVAKHSAAEDNLKKWDELHALANMVPVMVPIRVVEVLTDALITQRAAAATADVAEPVTEEKTVSEPKAKKQKKKTKKEDSVEAAEEPAAAATTAAAAGPEAPAKKKKGPSGKRQVHSIILALELPAAAATAASEHTEETKKDHDVAMEVVKAKAKPGRKRKPVPPEVAATEEKAAEEKADDEDSSAAASARAKRLALIVTDKETGTIYHAITVSTKIDKYGPLELGQLFVIRDGFGQAAPIIGVLTKAGELYIRKREFVAPTAKAFEHFAENPPAYLARIGKRLGFCCHCSKPLTSKTERSQDLGIGPVCAKIYAHWSAGPACAAS